MQSLAGKEITRVEQNNGSDSILLFFAAFERLKSRGESKRSRWDELAGGADAVDRAQRGSGGAHDFAAQGAYNLPAGFFSGLFLGWRVPALSLCRWQHQRGIAIGPDNSFRNFLAVWRSHAKSLFATAFGISINQSIMIKALRDLVLGAGLEPACLSAYAPQTYVSAIPPPERWERES